MLNSLDMDLYRFTLLLSLLDAIVFEVAEAAGVDPETEIDGADMYRVRISTKHWVRISTMHWVRISAMHWVRISTMLWVTPA